MRKIASLVFLISISQSLLAADLKELFIELGRKVNPAIVNVSTTQVVRMGGYPGMGPGGMPMIDPFFNPFMDPFGGGEPPAQKATSLGSGFIIDPNGLILTNNHVVRNANSIEVQLTEKSKPYKAKIIGQDARIDIALIKIDVLRNFKSSR